MEVEEEDKQRSRSDRNCISFSTNVFLVVMSSVFISLEISSSYHLSLCFPQSLHFMHEKKKLSSFVD